MEINRRIFRPSNTTNGSDALIFLHWQNLLRNGCEFFVFLIKGLGVFIKGLLVIIMVWSLTVTLPALLVILSLEVLVCSAMSIMTPSTWGCCEVSMSICTEDFAQCIPYRKHSVHVSYYYCQPLPGCFVVRNHTFHCCCIETSVNRFLTGLLYSLWICLSQNPPQEGNAMELKGLSSLGMQNIWFTSEVHRHNLCYLFQNSLEGEIRSFDRFLVEQTFLSLIFLRHFNGL